MLPTTVNVREVREKYNSRKEIWPSDDRWHQHTHKCIQRILREYLGRTDLSDRRVLNLGSGGNEYSVQPVAQIQLDIAERHLPRNGNSVVGSVESLPISSSSVDVALCVGAVLNYCDAAAAIHEIARVLIPGGTLVLEFESSRSAEYLGRTQFGKTAVFVSTTFQGGAELLWLYNPAYIVGLLQAVGLELLGEQGFHIGTTLVFRIFRNEKVALCFAWLDRLFFSRRFFRAFACNQVVLAKKSLKSS
jgi:SAM-dependent methyltransferase